MIAILLLIVAVLLLFAVREGFAATATIKNPNSWNAEEYARIKALVPGTAFTDAEIQDIVGGMWSVWSDATRPITMAQLATYMDRKPEYATRKAAAVNLLKAYYIDQFDYQFAGGHSEVVTTPTTTPATPSTPPVGSSGSDPSPTCPAGSTIDELRSRCTTTVDKECRMSTVLDPSIGKCRIEVGGRIMGDPSCPSTAAERPDGTCAGPGTTPTCPTGYTYETRPPSGGNMLAARRGVCLSNGVVNARVTVSAPPVTPSGASVDSTAADVGTTGGSSNSLGPTNIPAGTKGARVVYGPEWKGLGEGGLSGGDSTGTRSYPVLLGPEPVASTRIDGVGVVAPSQNYLLGVSGMLPSADSLGAGELSRFLPFSRPTAPNAGIDPWRVASAFSTASYSQKTDPVPFLADFSAFQR